MPVSGVSAENILIANADLSDEAFSDVSSHRAHR
jgi:hypothetical protein